MTQPVPVQSLYVKPIFPLGAVFYKWWFHSYKPISYPKNTKTDYKNVEPNKTLI